MLFPAAFGFRALQSTLVPLALQRVLSGISAVVIADLHHVSQSRHAGRPSESSPRPAGFGRYSFHAFVLAAVAPALVLSTGTVLVDRRPANGRRRQPAPRQRAWCSAITSTSIWADRRARSRRWPRRSNLVGDDPQQREHVLAEYVKIQTGFESLRIVSLQGDVTASAPPLPDLDPALGRRPAILHGPDPHAQIDHLGRDPRPPSAGDDRRDFRAALLGARSRRAA